MDLNKKALVVLAVVTLGTAGTALAVSADSFSDVPKDHWSYEALDYLAKEGVIEGMGNSTFEGGRTMTRYEVASIVAKAMQKGGGNFGDKTVLEKLHAEYADEINVLQQQVAKNTKQIEQNTKDIQENKEKIDRVKLYGFMRTQYDYDKDTTSGTIDKQTNRFYMDLRGDFKVNDYWTVKFQSETNRHYNDGHRRANEGGINNYGKDNYTGQKTWSGHDGNMQRIWVEGKKDGLGWINIGRAWRGLGFQNVLVGNETDGLQFGVPIKGTDLTASGFWFASTGDGNKESLYGAAIWGSVARNLDINFAYAKSSLDKGEINNSGNIDHYYADPNDGYKIKPVYGEGEKNPRSYGYVLSMATNINKDLRFIADYAKTDADFQNNSVALRLNYKDADYKKPGSYGLYLRYIKYGENGWLAGDDEWNSTWYGTKGWIAGVRYAPWKNIIWETMYSKQKRHWSTSDEYDRNLFRTELDFHF